MDQPGFGELNELHEFNLEEEKKEEPKPAEHQIHQDAAPVPNADGTAPEKKKRATKKKRPLEEEFIEEDDEEDEVPANDDDEEFVVDEEEPEDEEDEFKDEAVNEDEEEVNDDDDDDDDSEDRPRRKPRAPPVAKKPKTDAPRPMVNLSASMLGGAVDYESMKLSDLKELCKQKGLKVSGKKEQLIHRLQNPDDEENKGRGAK